MSFRAAPADARRGGLVILATGAEDGARLARAYADGGYETIVARAGDDIDSLIGELASPVFILAFPDAAALAWNMTEIAAASIIADGRIAPLVARPPGVPTILHLDGPTHATLADEFDTAQPGLPVHRLDATADSERLLTLRTLRLFAVNAGGRGEA